MGKSTLQVKNADGTVVVVAEAPEGYEFTGEYRIPTPSEPFYDGKCCLASSISLLSSKPILRQLKSAKERRAKRLGKILHEICELRSHGIIPYFTDQISEIEQIFEEER